MTAITLWPRSTAASAIPTTEPLTPEFDAMTNTSAGCTGETSKSSSTTVASRSSDAPTSTETSRSAVQHDVAQGDAIGRDQSAGASGDLHGERLGVPGAERLDDPAGAQRLDEQVARRIEGAVVGLPGESFEPGDHLGQEGACRCRSRRDLSPDRRRRAAGGP